MDINKLLNTLYEEIKHGDQDHQDWLKNKIEQFKNKQNMEVRDFGAAIKALKNGYKVSREGWNGKGMWLNLQVPDEHSKMSLPYIYMFTADKQQVPWLASQTDVLAEDWTVISE